MERRPLYLANAAAIAAQSGDPEGAREIIEELDQQPGAWSVGSAYAHVLRARAEVMLSTGEPEEAVRLFRDAVRVHQDMDALLEAAAVRLRLAESLLRLQDRAGAALELDSAESVLDRRQARLYVDDCRRLRTMLEESGRPLTN